MKILADIRAAKEALQAALAVADGQPVRVALSGTIRITATLGGKTIATEVQINEEV